MSIPVSRRSALSGAAGTVAFAAADLAHSADAQDTSTGAPIPKLDPNNPFATSGPPPKTSVPTHLSRKLKFETVTPENFAPFGVILTGASRQRLPINTYGGKMDLYREGFQSDQPTEWFIAVFQNRGTDVLFLERHQQLTQAFIPVGGNGFYTVVARPGAREENGFPALDELRAFWVPGDTAIQIHRATWHENPLVKADGTRLLVTSHANLTVAHQQNPDPRLAKLPLDLERRWYKAGGYDVSIENA